jgi:hypothetical protein
VRAGEIASSVKAVTEDVIKRLYESSQRFPPPKRNQGFIHNLDEDELFGWGAYRQRVMLHAAYTISFLCMLRFDEVLKIEAHHIEVLDETGETGEIRLTLPFRKTHQTGGKSPPPEYSKISKDLLSLNLSTQYYYLSASHHRR